MPWLIFLLLLQSVFAFPTFPITSEQTVLAQSEPDSELQGWLDPRPNGGRFLDVGSLLPLYPGETDPEMKYATPRFGEPLNIIISALSDPFILSENGLHYYAKCVHCIQILYCSLHHYTYHDTDFQPICIPGPSVSQKNASAYTTAPSTKPISVMEKGGNQSNSLHGSIISRCGGLVGRVSQVRHSLV
jgi:hypothetical protein